MAACARNTQAPLELRASSSKQHMVVASTSPAAAGTAGSTSADGAAAGAGAGDAVAVRVGGGELHFEPMSLAFEHVNYFVPNPKKGSGERELQLLRDVSGCFRPGVLTALMGASGAGGCVWLVLF